MDSYFPQSNSIESVYQDTALGIWNFKARAKVEQLKLELKAFMEECSILLFILHICPQSYIYLNNMAYFILMLERTEKGRIG